MMNRWTRTLRVLTWLAAFLVPLFAVLPALQNPIEEFSYDAAVFHVYRGIVFSAARADSALYPRWATEINAGLGGPLFSFYAPLPYFLLDALNVLGVPHPLAWRWLVAAFLVAASLGMFGLAKHLTRRADAALFSAAIFSYNSFLLRDLFERGSPQGFAVALFPAAVWLLARASDQPSGARIALAALAWAAIILLHSAAALVLSPVLGIFFIFLFLRQRARGIIAPFLALALGLSLSAFYFVPYFAELPFVQFDNLYRAEYTQPAANPIPLEQLLSLPRGYDAGLGNNSMGERGGLFHAFFLGAGALIAFHFWRAKKFAQFALSAGAAGVGALIFWLQTDAATIIWREFSALTVFQFRWKLLSAAALLSAMLAAFLACRWRKELTWGIGLIYIALQLPALYPQLQHQYARFAAPLAAKQAQTIALQNGVAGLDAYGEFLPRWRQMPFSPAEAARAAAMPIANLPDGARAQKWTRRAQEWQGEIETPVEFHAQFHLLYFPGWVGYVDDARAPVEPAENSGYLQMLVPRGAPRIILRYEGTPAQSIGAWISALGLIALGLIARRWRADIPAGSRADIRSGSHPAALGERKLDSAAVQLPLSIRWSLLALWISAAIFKSAYVDPQTLWLRAASTCEVISGASAQTAVWFGEQIKMCGYALARRDYRAGDWIEITIYWQTARIIAEPADSFLHLLGNEFNPAIGAPVWGQQDKQAPGEIPLTRWSPEKLYRDAYRFQIAPNAPPGEYQIEIGWHAAEGRLTPRLARTGGELAASHLDSIVLSGIRVRH